MMMEVQVGSLRNVKFNKPETKISDLANKRFTFEISIYGEVDLKNYDIFFTMEKLVVLPGSPIQYSH